MAEKVIVASAVKKSSTKNVSTSFYEALNKEVLTAIKKAEARAEANGRRTIRDCDL